MIAPMAATTGHRKLPMYVLKKTPGSVRLPDIPKAASIPSGRMFR